MAYNNNQQAPFWDFIRSFDPQAQGAGVDQPAHPHPPPPPPGAYPHPQGTFPQFPQGGFFPFGGLGSFGGPHHAFGPGHCGRGGRRGRGRPEHTHEHPHEGPHEHSEGEAREGSPHGPRHGFGRHGGRGGRHGGHRGQYPPPPFGGPGGFDLSALVESLSTHPLAQAFRNYAEHATAQQSGETFGAEDTDGENSFTPPIDVFSTETQYVLHVALPGAKKEDVGINWDAEKGVLNLAGVVYRQGDEEFLKTLSQSERKVGVFERTVKLPPGNSEEKDEVDGDAITAKLEDGVLVVTVPKVEREWTEVKRVDIQ